MKRKDCEISKAGRHATGRAALAVTLLVACAAPVQAGTIRLWREAVVSGGDVRLADVCAFRDMSAEERSNLGAIAVAATPVEGGSTIVTVDDVRRALRDSGVNLGTVMLKGAAHCDVTRPKRRGPVAAAAVSPNADPESAPGKPATAPLTLREAIEAFLADEIGESRGHVRVQFGRGHEAALELAQSDFAFEIERTSGRRLGMVGLSVTVIADDTVVQTFPMLVNVSYVKKVAVASRSLNVGAVIGASDVQLVEMTFERFEQVGQSELAAVIGQRVKRFVASGTVVMPRDLEPVPLVKRGQIVDVHSQVGGVAIVTAAKALDEGAYGDVIELRVGERGCERFTATVTGPGHVTVGGVGEALAMGEGE